MFLWQPLKTKYYLALSYSKALRRDLAPVDMNHAAVCLLPAAPHGNKEGIVKAAWIPPEPE